MNGALQMEFALAVDVVSVFVVIPMKAGVMSEEH